MKQIEIFGGVKISGIMFGGTKLGAPERDEAQFALMDVFYENGGMAFDSARVYANGECDASLGRWIKSRKVREKVTICTKGSHPLRETMHVSRLSRDEIIGDLDASLAALGMDHTDIHILHRDDPRLPVGGIMEALDSQVKAGKIRAIGVSNWTAGRINEANIFAGKNGLTPFSVSQTSFSLAQTTHMLVKDATQVPMNDIEFGWFAETKMPVMCFSAMANGFFSRYAAGREQNPGVLARYGFLPENMRRADRIKALSEETGFPVAAILAAYVRDCGINGAALCSFSDAAQLREALLSSEISLDARQIKYLNTGEN